MAQNILLAYWEGLIVKYATQRNMRIIRYIRQCQSVKYVIYATCAKRFILSAFNLQNAKLLMLTVHTGFLT